jgi:GAF domain-containing protein/HAMP domain-containing protein
MIDEHLNSAKRPALFDSLKGKLILLFLAVSLIPLIVMGLFAYFLSQGKLVEANSLGLLIFGGIVLVAGLVVGMVLWVTPRITNSISHLTALAREVAGGNLDVQAPVETRDETGELAEAFNVMIAQLRQWIGLLEEQVQERTAELAISIETGQRATAIRNMDELLPTITEFVREKFNLYYVQVFLVDDIGQNLVLRAGTGQAGQELLARRLSLPIDPGSAVGRATVEGQSIIVIDTSVGTIDSGQYLSPEFYGALLKKEQDQRSDSLLAEARSELAIPLIVGKQVIGVLDLQNDRIKTFTQDNLNVYEAMAIQLAIAIDSARQWAIAQEAQQKAEQAVQQLTREAWASRLRSSQQNPGFVYDLSKVTSLPPSTSVSTEEDLTIPLVVQDQAIGHLSVKTPANRPWSADEQTLLQAVAQQLAQKAENLRLFEATQQQANREQIARQIIDKVRASRNIEMALRTAGEELNKALSTAKATIDLQITPQEQTDRPVEKEAANSQGVAVVETDTSINETSAEETIPFDLNPDLS